MGWGGVGGERYAALSKVWSKHQDLECFIQGQKNGNINARGKKKNLFPEKKAYSSPINTKKKTVVHSDRT